MQLSFYTAAEFHDLQKAYAQANLQVFLTHML